MYKSRTLNLATAATQCATMTAASLAGKSPGPVYFCHRSKINNMNFGRRYRTGCLGILKVMDGNVLISRLYLIMIRAARSALGSSQSSGGVLAVMPDIKGLKFAKLAAS